VLGDTELRGGLQAMRELLTEEGEYATDETISNVDPEAGSKRGIPYYRKALDTLARTFAEAMNEANRLPDNALYQTNNDGQIIGRSGALYTKQDDGTFKKNDGTVVDRNTAKQDFIVADGFEKYFNRNAEGKYLDADGNVLSDADQNDPTKYVVLDNYKEYFGGNLFSVSGVSNQDGTTGDDPGAEKITAANISISYDWSHGKLHVLRSIDPNASTTSRASDNLAHFVTMLKEKHDFTTGTNNQGTSYFKGTFQEMLTDTISGTLAKDQNITGTMLNNYNATADSLYVDRDAVMGVDLNDEAMNMMQFQKAYSAACRLMTTYDEMLEKLINGTGI
jgi:flagellar hook-associated protein 1 FlgK